MSDIGKKRLWPEWGASFREMGFTSFSIVPASKCEVCQAPMERHNDTHWACADGDCPEKGKPVHTGVYPAREVENPMKPVDSGD